MSQLEYAGYIGASGQNDVAARHLYSLPLGDPSEFPDRLALRSACFILFVAWDAANATNDDIASFARRALRAGCAYLCAWGDDCERVHDIFDLLRDGLDDTNLVTTTWHANEDLDDALWFALFTASPPADEAFADKTRSIVACSIANKDYDRQIAAALGDPEALTHRVVGEETP